MTRRGTAAAYPEPLRHAPNAALLIDFDNVTMGIRSDLQVQLKRLLSSEVFKGKISVQRAYADWRRYPQYIVPLSEASIDLIFAPAFGSNKKNATDIRLAIDALELVFTRPEIGTYILLSGDSDFSSLVLKLKEYGKYVIGVGMRESSSDLLIQNCDEYYSYNELTGLLKEGEVEHRRRDPWELVVESATRMQRANDVMRSDRLKQVMQELDPNFDEKDAGFSKYSKFLQEAARRGLLRLSKMENGQYEIAVGPNANVPLELDGAPPPAARAEVGEARGRRRERPRGGEPRDRAAGEGLTLAEALALLRQALEDLGATGEESTDADQARERMTELHGRADEPVLEGRRFQRFLRQAHDAGVVDLAKSEGGVYLLRLRPAPAPEPVRDESAAPVEREHARPDGERGHRRGERGGRGSRGGRGRRHARDDGDERESREPAAARDAAPPVSDAPPARESQRNPRFRHGSRGRGGAPSPDRRPEPPVPSGPTPTTADETARAGPVTYNRAVRGRRGRRGGGGPIETTAPPAPGEIAAASPPVWERAGAETPSPAVPPPATPQQEPEQTAAEAGSLFKRMSAALQRAMLGSPPKDESDGS
jgi:uncharacterized protein (TIGR00288 family)